MQTIYFEFEDCLNSENEFMYYLLIAQLILKILFLFNNHSLRIVIEP